MWIAACTLGVVGYHGCLTWYLAIEPAKGHQKGHSDRVHHLLVSKAVV